MASSHVRAARAVAWEAMRHAALPLSRDMSSSLCSSCPWTFTPFPLVGKGGVARPEHITGLHPLVATPHAIPRLPLHPNLGATSSVQEPLGPVPREGGRRGKHAVSRRQPLLLDERHIHTGHRVSEGT